MFGPDAIGAVGGGTKLGLNPGCEYSGNNGPIIQDIVLIYAERIILFKKQKKPGFCGGG